MSFVDSALDAMDNIQPDPYAKGRTYSYSPSQYNFERYQKSPCYDKLGFSPYRDQAKQESDYCDCEDKYYRSLAWKIGITVAVLAVLAFFIIKYYKRKNQERASVNPENYDSPTTNKKTKDAGSTHPNAWLHPSDVSSTDKTFGAYNSINDRFAQANTLENNNSNDGTQTNDNMVAYQHKKIALDKLKKQGLISKEDYDIKIMAIENEENKRRAEEDKTRMGNRISLLKNELLSSVDEAHKAGVLTTIEAIMKKKDIQESFYCIFCKYSQKEEFKHCPRCGTRV